MKTTNCNIYKEKPDVYCGRGKGIFNNPLNCPIGTSGWLGNPIVIGQRCMICSKIHGSSGDTLPCYKEYLLNRLKEFSFKEEFLKLRGKKLGCFCKPKPCHTDIMIELVDVL